MSFVQPTWFEGAMYFASFFLIPAALFLIMGVIGWLAELKDNETLARFCIVLAIIFIICLVASPVVSNVAWHYQYEVPSVQEETITVENWQPVFGKYWGDVHTADDLMMQTKDGRLFGNTENFLFQKFETRDILNNLHVNGTYKIKYYGWREGYNNGVPNILSIEEVIDDNGTKANDISQYMNKRSIIIDDGNGW